VLDQHLDDDVALAKVDGCGRLFIDGLNVFDGGMGEKGSTAVFGDEWPLGASKTGNQ